MHACDTNHLLTIDTTLLFKNKETKTQVAVKDRRERLANLDGAFSVDSSRKDLGEHSYILIDDVTTTGATFSEARKTLERARAKNVWAYAIAH